MLYVQWCNLPMDTHTTVLGSVVAEGGGGGLSRRRGSRIGGAGDVHPGNDHIPS